jgi:Methyltransferase domain
MLPFAEGAFAGAFAKHSYLHVPKARIAGAFAELRRVLVPGGLVLLALSKAITRVLLGSSRRGPSMTFEAVDGAPLGPRFATSLSGPESTG